MAGRSLWVNRKNPALVGAQAMRGLPAEVLDWHGDAGHVLAQGERWQARGEEVFTTREIVEVTDVNGLTLFVRRPVRTESDGERP
jgi:membrane-bound serine protease (ClpP class)